MNLAGVGAVMGHGGIRRPMRCVNRRCRCFERESVLLIALPDIFVCTAGEIFIKIEYVAECRVGAKYLGGADIESRNCVRAGRENAINPLSLESAPRARRYAP